MREEFTFNSVHCDAHNTAFIVEEWPAFAKPTINKYVIGGRNGTVRYKGRTLGEQTLKGKLYLLPETDDVITYTEMLTRKTDISAWLCPGGRKRLIMDAAPDRFYMAEIEKELTISTDEWGDGCIPIEFTLQPYAYAVKDDKASVTLTGSAAGTATLTVRGNQPAPIAMELTSGGALTWAQMTLGNTTLRLQGMSLTAGQKIVISFDLEAGELMSITCAGAAGMCYLTAASPAWLEAKPGSNAISVNADAACGVQLSAKGRWQ